MWEKTELTKKLNLAFPIIQAPMAGGAITLELVAAVSNDFFNAILSVSFHGTTLD